MIILGKNKYRNFEKPKFFINKSNNYGQQKKVDFSIK
jgi:hypothetical protein